MIAGVGCRVWLGADEKGAGFAGGFAGLLVSGSGAGLLDPVGEVGAVV